MFCHPRENCIARSNKVPSCTFSRVVKTDQSSGRELRRPRWHNSHQRDRMRATAAVPTMRRTAPKIPSSTHGRLRPRPGAMRQQRTAVLKEKRREIPTRRTRSSEAASHRRSRSEAPDAGTPRQMIQRVWDSRTALKPNSQADTGRQRRTAATTACAAPRKTAMERAASATRPRRIWRSAHQYTRKGGSRQNAKRNGKHSSILRPFCEGA